MQYAAIKKNDTVDTLTGINVSFWVQGCPNHCPGCHNPDTWDFSGGKEFTMDVLNEIILALRAHGIKRNFSVLGGEPLCDENLFLTNLVCREIRNQYPDIKIYLWTGYTYEDLLKKDNKHINSIFNNIDILIDGRFEIENRDITLKMRGSTNQRIIDISATLSSGEITLMEFSDEQT